VSTRRARIGERSRIALFSLGLTLMVVAWIAATLPFAAPDEASHYDRALGLSQGQILGPRVVYSPHPALNAAELAFLDHDTRGISVPARLMPPNVSCTGGRPNRGRCIVATPNGNFPPLAYALPALALKMSHDAETALWLTRAASALQSITFLLLAAALLWSGSGWSVLGLLAAITPMVLFTTSVMNSSGVEIAACLAFAAAVLRITRDLARTPAWAWLAFVLAGAVGMLAGPIGVVFVAADMLLFTISLERRHVRVFFTRPAARISGLSLLSAALLAIIYARLAGFSGTFGISPLRAGLHEGVHQLWLVLQGAVGNFASLTVPMPLGACSVWWLLVIAMLAASLSLGTARERLVVGASAVLALAFPVLFYAWIDRHTGFGLQAREVLPALMLIPLVSGEVIFRHHAVIAQKRRAYLVPGITIGLVALFQAYAWWLSARVAGGAPHTIRFYAHATWRPPSGWLLWIAIGVVGTFATLAFAASELLDPFVADQRRRSSRQESKRPQRTLAQQRSRE
jgi:Predicted membrane protein (DUF2142)